MRLPKKPSDARKEVKRKARNWLDKQRPDRGVAKKRYHDLEEGVIFVFSKTTKVASLDMHTATIIVKKLLDKIVALVPDYRELCGMKNPVPTAIGSGTASLRQRDVSFASMANEAL